MQRKLQILERERGSIILLEVVLVMALFGVVIFMSVAGLKTAAVDDASQQDCLYSDDHVVDAVQGGGGEWYNSQGQLCTP